MGITERKEREKLEMRELILEAATSMFLEEGYEKTSIRNIAERIRVQPRYHFTFISKTRMSYFLPSISLGLLSFYRRWPRSLLSRTRWTASES
jgi:hypothetical protein